MDGKPMGEPMDEAEEELKGDGSIDPMEAAEDDLNPMPTDQDDPKTEEQKKKIAEDLDQLS